MAKYKCQFYYYRNGGLFGSSGTCCSVKGGFVNNCPGRCYSDSRDNCWKDCELYKKRMNP